MKQPNKQTSTQSDKALKKQTMKDKQIGPLAKKRVNMLVDHQPTDWNRKPDTDWVGSEGEKKQKTECFACFVLQAIHRNWRRCKR